MFKFRIVKLITVFVVAFSVLLCNTVYSFAYYPIVKVDDVQWNISSESTYSAEYPDRIDDNFAPLDDVYSISDLDGKTYYCSRYGADYTIDASANVVLPALDLNYTENSHGFLYQINGVFWLFFISDNVVDFYLETIYGSDGYIDYFNFCYKLSASANVRLYSCGYPFTSWTSQYNKTHTGSELNVYQVRKWHDNIKESRFSYYWTSHSVYSMSIVDIESNGGSMTDIVNDNTSFSSIFTREFDITYWYDVYLFAGGLSFKLSGEELRFLSSGECAVCVDDFGVVIGSETSVCFGYYYMNVETSDAMFSHYIYADYLFSDSVAYPGEYYFHDVFSFDLFDYDKFDFFLNSGLDIEEFYTVTLFFMFASDGYNLFFPGTFEIVEFEDYEEEMQHDEVVGAINDAVTSINGQISSSSSALSKEITGAISDMTSDINEKIDVKFDELMYGDTGYDKPDYDTGDLDNLSSQTDSTIDNILSQLDSDVLAQLPGGYTTFDAYFSSSVNTIHTDFSKAFLAVRNVFDRFVSVTDISVLLLFSLIFGFAIFVLGRSLKRD